MTMNRSLISRLVLNSHLTNKHLVGRHDQKAHGHASTRSPLAVAESNIMSALPGKTGASEDKLLKASGDPENGPKVLQTLIRSGMIESLRSRATRLSAEAGAISSKMVPEYKDALEKIQAGGIDGARGRLGVREQIKYWAAKRLISNLVAPHIDVISKQLDSVYGTRSGRAFKIGVKGNSAGKIKMGKPVYIRTSAKNI